MSDSICELCGSVLDLSGQHTKEFKTYSQSTGKVIRPKLYRVWANIKERCSNPNQQRYKDYGGRGIYLCSEWQDFATFRRWALDSGWQHGLQIDRRDNDAGYHPDNCRIVTRHQQQQNRRLPNRHKTGKRYNRKELTSEDVYFIRESQLSNRAVAEAMDIHRATVSNIRLRKSWGHLPERNAPH